MSTIAAGTTSGTALVSTGNTDGTLQLQVNGTTPSVTLATTGAIGVGSTPGYGTSGQVLTSAGSAAAPTWTTPSAGAMVYISTQTVSTAVASVNFTTGFSSTYDDYVVMFSNVIPSATDTFAMRLYKGGSVVSTLYNYGIVYSSAGSGAGNAETSNPEIKFFGTSVNTSCSVNGNVYISQANTSGLATFLITASSADSVSGTRCMGASGGGRNTAAGTVSGISFFFLAGTANLTSGTFKLYGIAKS